MMPDHASSITLLNGKGAVFARFPMGTRWPLDDAPLRLVQNGSVDVFGRHRGDRRRPGALLHLERVGPGAAIFPVGADESDVELIAVAASDIECLEIGLSRMTDATDPEDRELFADLLAAWMAAIAGEPVIDQSRDPGADWGARLLERVEDRLDRRAADAANRRTGRSNQDQTAAETSMATIASVGESEGRAFDPNPGGHDPLQASLHFMGRLMGFAVADLPSDKEGLPLDEKLSWLVGASHLRVREVSLRSKVWTEDGVPLLVFGRDDDLPRVAVPRAGEGWDLIEPTTRVRQALTAECAACLHNRGFMIYRSLPDKVAPRGLLRFSFANSGSDLRRVVVLSAVVAVLGLTTPIVAKAIVDDIIPYAKIDSLVPMIAALVAIAVSTGLFGIARAIALVRIEGRGSVQLQAGLWDRIMRLPSGFFRRYSVGDLAMRLFGVELVRGLVSGAVVSALLAGVFSAVNLILMLYFDWRLGLLAGSIAFAVVGAILLMSWLQLGHLRQVIEQQGRVTGIVVQLLTGISKLRVAAAETRAFNFWAQAFARQRRAKYRADTLRNTMTILGGLLPLLFAIFVFAAIGLRDGIDAGVFVAFNVALGQFLVGIAVASGMLSHALIAVPLFERLQPIVECAPEPSRATGTAEPLLGSIAVDTVSFRYADQGPLVLNDVSFQVEQGEFVAFVGASGSGKSTLIRVLLGFESPLRGTVYYDGRDLELLDVRSVRRQLGVVLQDAMLTPGTILENVIGASRLTNREAMEAIRMAGMRADLEAMPMGLQTYVAEGAGTLSGGQRQRLLIARALVRRPRILLLDEATSALDNATQAVVSRSLEQLSVTRIVIAHRLSTIENADRIYVMQAGRIVQQGRFDALMGVEGPFRDLAKRQIA